MLKAGKKLKRPRNCPENVYEVMCQCWQFYGDDRPHWNVLVNAMRRLYQGMLASYSL